MKSFLRIDMESLLLIFISAKMFVHECKLSDEQVNVTFDLNYYESHLKFVLQRDKY